MSHTPGPWSIPHFANGHGKCVCGYVFSESQHGMGAICEINYGGEDEPREIAEANARLIAASPDLLAALKECAARLEIHMKHSEDLIAHMGACKAIERATGEAP